MSSARDFLPLLHSFFSSGRSLTWVQNGLFSSQKSFAICSHTCIVQSLVSVLAEGAQNRTFMNTVKDESSLFFLCAFVNIDQNPEGIIGVFFN